MIDLDVNAFRALSDPRRELTVARQTHRRIFRNRIPRRGGGLFGALPLYPASSESCITNHDRVCSVRTCEPHSPSRGAHIFSRTMYIVSIKKYSSYDLDGISR